MTDVDMIQNAIDAAGLRKEYDAMVDAAIGCGMLPSATRKVFTKTMGRLWLHDKPLLQKQNLSVSIAAITHMMARH